MTSPTQKGGVDLGWSLLSALLVVALLSWALFMPSPTQRRAARPPLLTPVALDFINEVGAPPVAASPATAEASSAAPNRDGLRPW